MKHHCEGLTGWYSGECPQPVISLRPGELFTDPQAVLIGQFVIIAIAVLVILFISVGTWSLTHDS